ncbi:hypothetical protein DSO57_1031566 [Entomophthora muscae]|uniref:Uncharacterized protein n=1 Tax=Entomophthora muscae TaxID=34485 RepID=A0ACC2U9M3_9FUNG|nr:hypothetical protein DSO57_1031566 [Entomophthora muscae]
MILPVLKFVVFSLGPFLLLLWTTSPDLWACLSSFTCLAGNNPYSLLHLPTELFTSGKDVVKSLTCDNLEFNAVDHAVPGPTSEEVPVSTLPNLEVNNLVPLKASVKLPVTL